MFKSSLGHSMNILPLKIKSKVKYRWEVYPLIRENHFCYSVRSEQEKLEQDCKIQRTVKKRGVGSTSSPSK